MGAVEEEVHTCWESLETKGLQDTMLPQFPLSKIGSDPPTCLSDQGESSYWGKPATKKKAKSDFSNLDRMLFLLALLVCLCGT